MRIDINKRIIIYSHYFFIKIQKKYYLKAPHLIIFIKK